ncbi:MAG TPA: leucyl aminopeptidase [Candidatus Baltobacteraceae bacterium]|nr:leucyl aminopeptidase [Candidatus Baltobacteraceae bacterium]
MQVRIVADAPAAGAIGALVVPVSSGASLDGVAKTLDAELNGAITEVLSSGEIKGKLSELSLLHTHDRPYKRVLIIGLGEADKFEPWMLARYGGAAVRHLGRKNVREVAFALPPQVKGNETACASFLIEGVTAGAFDTSVYQKDPDRRSGAENVTILAQGFDEAALRKGAERGQILGDAVNLARRLAITPANDMTPTRLADEATKAAKDSGLQIEVLDESRCRELGMGSFLSVAQGSVQPPKFIVMTYNGDPGSKELLALVGKGITFDSGGISIKPAERMEEMKYDMSGGAGVIAAMSAIGKLKPKLNVVGIVPATENMPGGKATKPGDIFTAMNGKTIEVINTDAEGRLILADALCYANKLGATKIVDAATLTGACVIALGHAASAAVSNNDDFAAQFLNAAKPTGERYWQLPLYEDYSTAMKSDIADLKNTGGRPAGTLTASAFLKAFAGDTPWVHLDIAGTAYLDSESAWQAKGPTGTPVRAFVSLVEQLSGSPVIHTNGTAKATASV